ncbi:MAG TPA: CBS domain-containing protein, partial [Thermodesulfobacteriota bacterium]|nr:CBS domain-containing protein [Thermodesulfobacteriota bacterium]
NVELTVMGSKVFQQLSGSLAPFKQFLEDAVRRRSSDVWQRIPVAYTMLESEPLTSFIKPVTEKLTPSDTFRDAVSKLSGSDIEFCCVADEAGRLLGIVTRTDLFRAVDTAVRPETSVSEFMNKTPVYVAARDSSISVAGTLRVRDLKWVPVVDDLTNKNLVGYVRRDGMIGFVLERLSRMSV